MRDLPTVKQFQRIRDERGLITIFDLAVNLPFVTKRVFMLTEVPSGVQRGGHGHRKCQQYLVSLAGSWELNLVGIDQTLNVEVSDKSNGVYIPVNTYLTMRPLIEGSVLCVFASEAYDPDDYFYEIPVKTG